MRILYLDLDTLRPDHLGCYGYNRNTSPNIDKIAEQAIRFDNYYCSDAPCLPSRTALMTGRFGIHNGVVNHGGACADIRVDGKDRGFHAKLASDCLPSILKRNGMRTVSISPFPDRHSAWQFMAGFTETHDTGMRGQESATDVNPTFLKWIKANAKEDNWFLHVNYWDAHTPYRAPEEFGNPFENEPLPEWITDEVLEQHQKMTGPFTASNLCEFTNDYRPNHPRQPHEAVDRKSLRKAIDGYDCGIRFMDEKIGEMMDALKEEGVLDDLIIIVSSDHEENMGEFGVYGEHGMADNGTCRIPMIIRWPEHTKEASVDKELHYGLDLAPTLAEMLDQKPAPRWDGKSYAKTIKDGTPLGHNELIISQCAHVCQRSVRFDDWIYIRTYHDGFHLFNKEMLFNLKDDPFEQNDLALERPEICREAAYRLLNWQDDMMNSMEHDNDPLWTVMKEGGPYHAHPKHNRLKGYCEHLDNVGNAEAATALREKYPDYIK
jgi:arylsulfatase A-like enzyme